MNWSKAKFANNSYEMYVRLVVVIAVDVDVLYICAWTLTPPNPTSAPLLQYNRTTSIVQSKLNTGPVWSIKCISIPSTNRTTWAECGCWVKVIIILLLLCSCGSSRFNLMTALIVISIRHRVRQRKSVRE